LLAALLLAALTASAAPPPDRCTGLAGDLRDGRPTVIIVSPPAHDLAPRSEAYADWAFYRDDFLRRRPEDLCVLRMAAAAYRRRFAEPVLSDRFATIFVRDPDHALVYPGLILEPDIYRLGVAFLRGQDIDGAPYGLQDRRLRSR
jgi:hypothetical protein